MPRRAARSRIGAHRGDRHRPLPPPPGRGDRQRRAPVRHDAAGICDPAHAAVISGATGVAAATAGGARLPARRSACRCAPPPPRSATRWNRRSPPIWRWRRWRCRDGRLFAPLEPRSRWSSASCDGWGHWRGEVAVSTDRCGPSGAARRMARGRGPAPRTGSDEMGSGRDDCDSRGRPVVVVTGIGVLTSLGAGTRTTGAR